ncbi:hypothetical protein [Enterococcus wangshanyuanii]|uniref:Carbohydrate-binding protein n=1 Tax=Enterococcus wangshanyuanii TaxID=2005703 RepID=A0ABQ1PHG2_9ENTE|nr:hypothetical protein [Enterococcus wangshanyuanii]GGC97395.1 hypothetical protein GCM10011573_28650 [Enterococcus wangshanyuanii]
MIKIELKNEQDQTVVGRIDHEKEEQFFVAEGKELAVLAIKNYSYEVGDKIVVTVTGDHPYFVAQLDETLAPTIIYLPQKTWEYTIPLEESARKASVETAFRSTRHHIMVRQAHVFEIEAYQNLTFNSHDQKEFSSAYPHAHANVETRDDAVFFAKNAIDGKFGNLSHGSYPFASWGINQQADAALTIDFGRMVEIDWVRLLFRADYPHDSYWTEVTLAFSDGEERIVETTNAVEFQEIHFPMKETSRLTFKQLKKATDDSPFPALTQIEVFGRNQR